MIEQAHGGAFSVRVEGRAHPYPEVGATFLDADNGVGDRGRLGFVQGLASLPVFFSRNSKPGTRKVLSPREIVKKILEWALSCGRPGGQYSVLLPAGATPTALTATPQTLSGAGVVRTTAEHLYRAYAAGGTLRIARHPIGDPSDPEVWDTGLDGWGDPQAFILLEHPGGIDLVVSGAGTSNLHRLRWQAEEPVWSHSRADLWQWWGDPLPVAVEITTEPTDEDEDPEPQTVAALACYVYDYEHAGIAMVRADNGEEIRVGAIPWEYVPLDWPFELNEKIGLRDAQDDADALHKEHHAELTPIRGSSFQHKRQPAMRGLLAGAGLLFPAVHYSDQLIAIDPSTGERKWSVKGWRDFNPEPEEEGEVTWYERLTSVAVEDGKLLAFVSRFGFVLEPEYQKPIVGYDHGSLNFMRFADIEDVDADSEDTLVVIESFDSRNDAEWIWPNKSYEAIWGDLAGEVNAWSATVGDFELEDEKGGDLFLAAVEHLWRTYDAATGAVVAERAMASIDAPLVNGAASGAPDWASEELLKGPPDGRVSKTTLYTREESDPWGWGEEDTETEWAEVPEGKVKSERFAIARLRGVVYICDDVYGAPHHGGEGRYDIRYPYLPGTSRRSYPFFSVRHIRDVSDIPQYSQIFFLMPDDIEWPVDYNDLEWGVEWTEAEVTTHTYYHDELKVPLSADAAPRWNAVDCAIVDGRAMFGPGRRQDQGGGGMGEV